MGDHVVARGSTGHAIDLAAIDRAHGRAYLLTDVATTDAQYRTTYSLPLWTLDLRTGRVLSQWSILSGAQAKVPDALGVDEATGDLVLAAHLLYQTTRAEVIQVDPATMETQTQALPAAASAIMVDGAARRVVASSTIGAYPATTTLTAFQTGSLQQRWTRAYTYSLTASAMDDRAHRVWAVAPGGRVTALDIATGREAAQMRLAYTRVGTFDQRGVALDSAHSAAYLVWQEGYGSACHIDRADVRSGERRTISTYDCTATGAKLLGYDPTHAALVIGGGDTLAAVNPRTGAAVSTTTNLLSLATNHTWDQAVVLTANGRTSVAVPNEVAHQDDETGATTAGAIVFVSL